jgi:hypothetical protein
MSGQRTYDRALFLADIAAGVKRKEAFGFGGGRRKFNDFSYPCVIFQILLREYRLLLP